MNKIAAIVVTYNRCDLLLECINALRSSNEKVDVLIIDNASTDNTSVRVKEFIDNETIFYFNTGKNLGGAGGFNYGLKTAYERGYDYFWLMDDDTIVRPDSLSFILQAKDLVGENFGFISSLALWKDDSVCKMNHHYISGKWGDQKKFLSKGILRIEVATFVSFFTRKEVVKEIGFPIKEYFIWGDDTEFSLRAARSYPCYLAAQSVVVHKMKDNQGASNFADFSDTERIQRMSFAFRNGCFTHRQKNIKQLIRYVQTGAKIFFNILKTKKPYKFKKMSVLIKSYFVGIFLFHPRIEKPQE